MIRVRILTENRAKKRGIIGEHGLSILIETGNLKILFDVGQTEVFSFNSEMLNEDISSVDTLVLSHGHYDHTGGISEFCRINKKAPIYIHPDSLYERYNSTNGIPTGQSIGVPWSEELKESLYARTIFVKLPEKIAEGIMISGEVTRYDHNNNMVTNVLRKDDSGSFVEDNILDEQFIIIEREEGIYIFLGCSHPGLLNCVEYAKEISGNSKILGIIGGMHMEKYEKEEIVKIMNKLKHDGVEKIVPLHCTGIIPTSIIKEIFKDKCIILNCGDEIFLN